MLKLSTAILMGLLLVSDSIFSAAAIKIKLRSAVKFPEDPLMRRLLRENYEFFMRDLGSNVNDPKFR